MAFTSQWSGAQIDAAVGSIRKALGNLKKIQNIVFGLDLSNPPADVTENYTWESEQGVTQSGLTYNYKFAYSFAGEWSQNKNFPIVYFYNEDNEKVEVDYSFVFEDSRTLITGIVLYSNFQLPLLVVCANTTVNEAVLN